MVIELCFARQLNYVLLDSNNVVTELLFCKIAIKWSLNYVLPDNSIMFC